MLKAFINMVMAVLVIGSSGGFVLAKHYCMGELKSMAVFGAAEQCEMQRQPACPIHEGMQQFEKKGCCENEVAILQGIDITTTGTQKVELTPDLGIFVPLLAFVSTINTYHEKGQWQYTDLPPPLVHDDIPVFVQSFLL